MFFEEHGGVQLDFFEAADRVDTPARSGFILRSTGAVEAASPVVAVIDDDERIRLSTVWLLKSSGYQVLTFASGEDFLAARLARRVDAVILDMNMPGLNGLDVLRGLEAQEEGPAVIVLTAHGELEMAVEAMRLRAADFIQKPCPPGELLGALRRALALRTRDGRAPSSRARALVDALTPRQRQVLAGMIAGQANKTIAWDLGLSVRTVEEHRAQLIERLGVGGTAEAIRVGLDAGLGPRDCDEATTIRVLVAA